MKDFISRMLCAFTMMVIWTVSASAAEKGAAVGPNPCCPWNVSGNCTIADSEDARNQPGVGAYSTACAAYLEKCAEPWMKSATNTMRNYIAQNYQVFMQDLDGDTNVNDLANRIVGGPWKALNPDGKCMSAGFETGKYIGIYNCRSDYEKNNKQIGCPLFKTNEFAGVVIRYPFDGLCPNSNNEQPTSLCAFNLYVPQNNIFQYAATLKPPFNVQSRPWFVKAKSDTSHGVNILWLAPYKNYETGHPVFGYTQGIFQGEIFTAAALVLQYVADSTAYKTLNKSCLPAGN